LSAGVRARARAHARGSIISGDCLESRRRAVAEIRADHPLPRNIGGKKKKTKRQTEEEGGGREGGRST